MLSLNIKKVVDPQLIPMGVGVFGSTFLATQLGDLLERQSNPLVVEYRRELVGAILTIGGTLMMRGNREMRTVGMAIGATGVASVLSGLVRRIVDRSPTTAPSYRNGVPQTGGGSGFGDWAVNPPALVIV